MFNTDDSEACVEKSLANSTKTILMVNIHFLHRYHTGRAGDAIHEPYPVDRELHVGEAPTLAVKMRHVARASPKPNSSEATAAGKPH